MPLMFMAHEPQMPSRQERRKVSVESDRRFDLDQGIQHHRAAALGVELKVSMRGFSPESGLEAVDAEGARLAARRAAPVRDALDGCGSWRAGGIRPSAGPMLSRCAPWAGSVRPRPSWCSGARAVVEAHPARSLDPDERVLHPVRRRRAAGSPRARARRGSRCDWPPSGWSRSPAAAGSRAPASR